MQSMIPDQSKSYTCLTDQLDEGLKWINS